ncbi:MAG TPA: DUF3313 family protein [Steroidobacteraceae bacterium]|nr:DUF3313 family protein [Steroidobacteraceae bacterium]
MKTLTTFLATALSAAALLTAALLTAGCAAAPAPKSAPAPDLAHYRAVVIESVRIAPEAGLLSTANRAALERQLHVALVDSIPPAQRAVTPAADVVRVQVTVTALDAVDPVKNGVSTTLLGVPLDRGAIAFEARFYAADGSEPFATITEQRKAGAFAFAGSFSHYGHAVGALHGWGAELAEVITRT